MAITKEKIRSYCDPGAYEGVLDTLYHNNGDSTFSAVTGKAGLKEPWGKGLGVVWSDLDDDGYVDLYVAKDAVPNALFRNKRDGTFEDVTMLSGTGFSEDGEPESGMGTDAGDFDGDGRFDLLVCNLSREPNQLYRNGGGFRFDVATFPSGFGEISVPFVGFGANFFDYDNDADLDIYVTNGHIIDNITFFNDALVYAQRDFLFENVGGGKLKEVGRERGAYFPEAMVGRGVALADIDGDGDLDAVISNSDQRAVLLRNDGGNARHFLRLHLIGSRSNRDALGARVTVTAQGKRQIDEVRSGTSFASQNELVLHFGLGEATRAEKVEIRWPSGGTQSLTNVKADQLLAVREAESGSRPAKKSNE